jgi:CDP-diglyceride synthetase
MKQLGGIICAAAILLAIIVVFSTPFASWPFSLIILAVLYGIGYAIGDAGEKAEKAAKK